MKYLFLFVLLIIFGCNTSNESKADSYNKDGETEKAIQFYKLAIDEGSVPAMNKLALLYSNERNEAEAKKYYIMSFEKGDLSAAEILSSLSLRDNNYQDVIKYSKKLADEGKKEMVYNLGESYLFTDQYDLAVKYLKMDADNVYIKDPLGEAYYKKGDFVNAEKYWKSAVDNHTSGATNSHKKLLDLYLEQGRQQDYDSYKDKYQR